MSILCVNIQQVRNEIKSKFCTKITKVNEERNDEEVNRMSICNQCNE